MISIDVTSVAQRWANGSLAAGGFLISTLYLLKATIDSKERAGGTRAVLDVVTQDGPRRRHSPRCQLSSTCRRSLSSTTAGSTCWIEIGSSPSLRRAYAAIVQVQANNVVLDLRGHTIDASTPDRTAVAISGNSVTLKSGKVITYEQTSVTSIGANTVIESAISTEARYNGVALGGDGSVIQGSSLGGGASVGGRGADNRIEPHVLL